MPKQSSTSTAADAGTGAPAGTERIERRLARAGLCSRRDAKRWIAEGRVSVDGRVVDAPSFAVGPSTRITVDGKPVPALEPTRLWRCHKPPGVVTTTRDPEGRPTLFAQLPQDMPRVISVGRLDLPTEGLILLTNDGALARAIELPATGWIRRYRVRVHGDVVPAALEALERGVTVEGVRYGPVQARLDRRQGSNAWLTVALAEGRNREVRRVLGHLGLTVTRLIRLSYGPFQLGHLERGMIDEVPARVLRDQVGHLIDRTRPDGSTALRTSRRASAPPPAPRPVEGRPKRRPVDGPVAPPRGEGPTAPRSRAPSVPARPPSEPDAWSSDADSDLHITRRPGTTRPARRGRPVAADGKPTPKRSTGGPAAGGRPAGGKPAGGKPAGGKPAGGKPAGKKPAWAKSRGKKAAGPGSSEATPTRRGPGSDRSRSGPGSNGSRSGPGSDGSRSGGAGARRRRPV